MHRLLRTAHVCNRLNISNGSHKLLGIQALQYFCTHHEPTRSPELQVPRHARVIVCGGGIVGTSIAYHLTKYGERDVLLMDQRTIGSGVTSYSAGIIGQLKGKSAEIKIIQYSIQLYEELSKQYGLNCYQSGTLVLARSKHRFHHQATQHQKANYVGTATELLTRSELMSRHPYLNAEKLEGGLFVKDDIIVDTHQMNLLLAKLAEEQGASVLEHCRLKEVVTDGKKVVGVSTNHGDIACDVFINAAGQWARMIGKLSRPRVRVPIHAVEHYYFIAAPKTSIDPNMPVIRDYDNHCYFRGWGDLVMAGAFEESAKPIFHEGVPDNFNCSTDRMAEDWDQLHFMIEKCVDSLPAMGDAVMKDVVTGCESFSPDRHWILGQTPEYSNYYLATGFCGAGTAAAGGVGNRIAQLVIHGDHIDWHDAIDIKRFVDLHNNNKYLRARVKEVVGFEYGVDGIKPDKQYKSARGLRVSQLYTRLIKAGAVCGENVGFERALYFKSNEPEEQTLNLRETVFGKPTYFDSIRNEYWACRENVCVVDMTSFAKLDVRADRKEDVVNFLQNVCANDIDQPVGTVIHSGMLNSRGGYENDASLFRMEENRYMVIAPASQQTRNVWWLNKQLRNFVKSAKNTVQISDLTSMYTVINLIGSKARELLDELTDVSTKVADFPHMRGKHIYVANAGDILAMRLTHAGEDGFMLYIPSEYALHVYDTLMQVGKDYGIRNAGYFALRSLRTEKFFAYWGTDLNSTVTPLECNRESRVKLNSDIEFIGRDALLKQQKEGVKKRFVMFTLQDFDENRDNFPWNGEPILRNGEHVGHVTSSAFGFTLNQMVCLGFISHPRGEPVTTNYILDKTARYQVNIGNKSHSARALAYAPKIEPANLGFYLPTQNRYNF